MKNLKNYVMFIVSYFLNAFGNALMIKGSVGALVWASTFENFGAFFGITVGAATSILQVVFYIISKLIGRDFNPKDTVICVSLSVLFGTLIDFFLFIIGKAPYDKVILNYGLLIFGIIIISIAVSLAIKANVAFLALDDFLKNLKIHVFKGNVVKAMLAQQSVGFVLAIIFGLLHGEIYNMSIVTIVASLTFGNVVAISDKLLGFDKKDNLEVSEVLINS